MRLLFGNYFLWYFWYWRCCEPLISLNLRFVAYIFFLWKLFTSMYTDLFLFSFGTHKLKTLDVVRLICCLATVITVCIRNTNFLTFTRYHYKAYVIPFFSQYIEAIFFTCICTLQPKNLYKWKYIISFKLLTFFWCFFLAVFLVVFKLRKTPHWVYLAKICNCCWRRLEICVRCKSSYDQKWQPKKMWYKVLQQKQAGCKVAAYRSAPPTPAHIFDPVRQQYRQILSNDIYNNKMLLQLQENQRKLQQHEQ